jgi:two-component system, OmpR family, phosphate regulon sensor histidine kinase PhoR
VARSLDAALGTPYHHECPVDHHVRVIALEAGPLLLLAALYLGLALALAPELWRGRGPSLPGFGIWTLFVLLGAVGAFVGTAIVLDDTFLHGISPWPAFGVTLFAYLPALLVLARWRERALLIEGGRRVREAEEQASQHRRGAEAISRLSTALTHTASESEAAARLFDELESVLQIDRALLAVVDEDEGQARGLAARGVDEAWWQGITLDLDRDQGGIVTVIRERAPFAVFDAASAPNVNRKLYEMTGGRSAAFVPLLSDERVAGVLVAISTTPRLFSAREMELIVDLANETALALGRTRSDEALELALDRERLVAKISRRVRSELDLDAVLQVAVEEVGRALGVSRCFIRLGESDGRFPVRAEWLADGFEPIGESSRRLPASNLAVRERRTIAIADVEAASELDADDRRGRQTLLELGTRSVLATPVLVFDRMIGVFALHRAEARPWSTGEISLAEAVARELGLAVHTAQLLSQNRRRLEEQAALLKAAQVLTSDLRFDSVIQRLVHEVLQLFRADAADCWIFDEQRRLLRCRAVLGVDERNVGREIPPAGTFKAVTESGRPVLKREFAATERPPPSDDYAVFAEIMDAPITWLGEARGLLGVCAREDGHFDSADLELLDTFARLASLALHNAESFEERERQAQVQRGFYRIAEILGSTLSLAETVDALAQAASDALGGAAALVLEPRGDRLHVAGSHQVPTVLAEELAGGLLDSAAPFGGAAREERILTAPSLADDGRFSESLRMLLQDIGYRSLLCAPVAGARGEMNAAVVLFLEERDFSDDDLALARHLTGAARGAIERSELFEGERRARAFSQRLADLGGVLATKLDPVAAFDETVREAPALLNADAAVIRILENDELVVHAAWGPGTAGLVGTRSGSAAGVAGVVAQSRSPLAVGDARSTPRFVREDPLLRAGEAGVVAVPMFAHGGGFHGVLSVYDRTPRAWRDDEVQALAAQAATAAAAFSSATLYARVAEEKERNEAILANIADGIVAVDRDDSVVLWNATAEQITGVPAAEALGRRVADVLQRELASEVGATAKERQISISRGGKEVWLSLTEAVMVDAAGSVAGRIFAFRDISAERVLEQMKSDFVATVSHELRTPLTSIYGFAETLLRSDVAFSDEERRTFLSYIASESERLINIVDDLLNVARLEAGTLGLNIESTDVREVVSETVSRFAEHADGGYTFDLRLPRTAMRVRADKEKLKQIVMNIIDNAVKFSPAGGQISVSARRRSDTVEIRVIDEGIGIPRSDQQRIFTKFYRSEHAAVHNPQGTGLGLFLARGLLAAMSGRIWVESTEGEGSTFVCELPVAADRPGRPARAAEPAASAR